MKPYPPLGILYISAFLKKNGVDCQVFDSTFSSREELEQKIMDERPKIIAIYSNLVTKVNVVKLMKFIRSKEELNDTKIILGGPDITYNTHNYLNSGADTVVIGEGEQTMLELAEHYLNKKHVLNEIQGLAFLESGLEIKTPPRIKMKELADLPWPDRKAIDLNKYIDVWKDHHGQTTVSVSTQRGCPYTCKWCSTAVYGQSYRRRPAADVVNELRWIKENYNPDSIWFVDDVFTVSHKWLEEFCDLMIEADLKLNFECITRAERLNEPVLAHLKKAGCFRIWIGAESGSQRIIDAMDRRVDVNVVRSMIRQTKAHGIETGTFIMVGYPGEDESDITETITHLLESDPDHFTITLSYPIRGTELFNEVESKIITEGDWETTPDRALDFERTHNQRFYNHAIRRVTNEVWFAKAKKKRGAFAPSTIKHRLRSDLAYLGMKYQKLVGK
ncbi:MAG: anaerobic magnesium-protoporphyrin IX monomethyl ester cyclase [Bacteroidia bacterium]|jgi:anaerobic magnesium-protoporphyrin IX monomethyl ester cyclase